MLLESRENLKLPNHMWLCEESQDIKKQPVACLKLSNKANLLLLGMKVRRVDQLLKMQEKTLYEKLQAVYKEHSETFGLKGGFLEVGQEILNKLNPIREQLIKNDEQARKELKKALYCEPIPNLSAPSRQNKSSVESQSERHQAKTRIPDEQTKIPMEARNQKVLANLGLVHFIARRQAGLLASRGDPSLDIDDLIQAGCVGLIIGTDRYPDKNCPYENWIGWYIRKLIHQEIRQPSGLDISSYKRISKIRQVCKRLYGELRRDPTIDEVVSALDGISLPGQKIPWTKIRVEETFVEMHYWHHAVSLDEGRGGEEHGGDTVLDTIQSSDSYEKCERDIQSFQRRRLVEKILSSPTISKRQRLLIRLHWGLDGETHTLEEIGNLFGVSRAAVSAELKKILRSFATEKLWQEATDLCDGLKKPDHAARKNMWHREKPVKLQQSLQKAMAVCGTSAQKMSVDERKKIIAHLYLEGGVPFTEIQKTFRLQGGEKAVIQEFITERKEVLALH